MIIFDLDGTLANCDHRRHFIKPFGYSCDGSNKPLDSDLKLFKPDWKSFYEACDKDEPIQPVTRILNRFERHSEIQIWSGRCESVRQKTLDWIFYSGIALPQNITLKMRPIGDNTPDHELKFYWANDTIIKEGKDIEFVFDSDVASIAMWKCRNIFVFDCSQYHGQF